MSLAVLGLVVALVGVIGAIWFLVVALDAYVEPLLGAALAAATSAAGCVCIVLVGLIALRLACRNTHRRRRLDMRDPANSAELMSLVSSTLPGLFDKGSPLADVGIAALAGFLYGTRR